MLSLFSFLSFPFLYCPYLGIPDAETLSMKGLNLGQNKVKTYHYSKQKHLQWKIIHWTENDKKSPYSGLMRAYGIGLNNTNCDDEGIRTTDLRTIIAGFICSF